MSAPPPEFRNHEQILAAHEGLAAELEALLGEGTHDDERPPAVLAAFRAQVESFLDRVARSGVWLYYDADRVSAVSLLSGWINDLYRLGCYGEGERPPSMQLAPFSPELQTPLREEDFPYATETVIAGLWDRHVTLCLQRLAPPREAGALWTRLLVIAGAPGSGRSNLLESALAPALARTPLAPGTAPVQPLRAFMPGRKPLEAVVAHLAAANLLPARPVEELAAELRAEPARLAEWLRAVQPPRALLVDRLEELFTLGASGADQQTFLEALRLLASDPRAGHAVVAVFDSEFAGRLAGLEFFAVATRGWVGVNLDPNELRKLIVTPARRVGLLLEEGLAEQLIADIQGDPAAITLVQFTLRRLWQRRERNKITWSAYKDLCSGRLALDLAASETLGRFAPERTPQHEHREAIVRAIFLALVQPDAGGGVSVQPLAPAPLEARVAARWQREGLAGAPAPTEIREAVELFRGERLLTLNGAGELTVTHEALVTRWHKLVEWLDHERGVVRHRTVLRTDAEKWDGIRKNPREQAQAAALLYPGPKLAEWEPLRTELRAQSTERDDPGYGRVTLEFLDESAAQAARTRFWRRLVRVAAVIVALGVVAGYYKVREFRQRAASERARLIEVQRRAELEHAAEKAQLAEARQRTETAHAREKAALEETAKMSMYLERGTSALAERDPAGALLWFAGPEDTAEPDPARRISLGVALRQLPRLSEYLASRGFGPPDISRQGDRALLPRRRQPEDPGGVLLWSLRAPDAPALALGTPRTVARAVFSPDGQRAAVIVGDPGATPGRLEIWDLAAQPPALLVGQELPASLSDVAFSPKDSDLLAVCGSSDSKAQGEVWLVTIKEKHLHPLLLQVGGGAEKNGPATCLAFSADGALLAVGHKIGEDRGRVRVFKVAQPVNPRAGNDKSEKGDTSRPVVRVSFSADEPASFLAAATNETKSDRGDVRVYRIDPEGEGELPQLYAAPLMHEDGGAVADVQFSPAGTRMRLLSAGTAGTACLWDLATGRLLARLPHDGWTFAVAWSPDGTKVATGSRDRTARVWDASNGEALLPPLEHGATVSGLRFTPDGTRLLTIASSHARLWETELRERSVLPPPVVPGGATPVLSTSGNLVVTPVKKEGAAGRLMVHRLGSHAASALRLEAGATVRHFAVSEDDAWALASTEAGHLLTWNLATADATRRPSPTAQWKLPDTPLSATTEPAKRKPTATQAIGFAGGMPPRVFVVREPVADRDAEKGAGAVVEIFDATNGKALRPAVNLPFAVTVVAVSADGAQLALGGGRRERREGPAAVVATTGNEAAKLLTAPAAMAHDEPVQALAFAPDGSALITGSTDDSVCVWELPAAEPRWKQRIKHTADVTSVAFSPGGKYVLSTSFDSTAVVRDARTGDELATVQHRGTVRAGAFDPADASFFATGGDDRTARLWHLVPEAAGATGRKLRCDSIAVLPHTCDLRRVSFDPRQHQLLTAGLRKLQAGADERAPEFRRWDLTPAPVACTPAYFRQLGATLGSRVFFGHRVGIAPRDDVARLWPGIRVTEHRDQTVEELGELHAHEARLAENAGNRAAAAWHLARRLPKAADARDNLELLEDEVRVQSAVGAWDRVLAAAELVLAGTPDVERQQEMRAARANALLQRGRDRGAPADLTAALTEFETLAKSGPARIEWRILHAETLVLLGRLPAAITVLRAAIADPNLSEPGPYQRLAALHLRLGETEAYETIASEAFARFAGASVTDISIAARAAWCAVLGAAQKVEGLRVREVLVRALEDMPESFYRRNTYAALLYREGNAAKALEELDKSARLYARSLLEEGGTPTLRSSHPPGRPIDWMFLALVHLARSQDAALSAETRATHATDAARHRAAVAGILTGNQLADFGAMNATKWTETTSLRAPRMTWNRLDLEVLLAEYDRRTRP